ncbi:hypothetical protein FOZ61_005229, partial [Perkinsus olseni]
ARPPSTEELTEMELFKDDVMLEDLTQRLQLMQQGLGWINRFDPAQYNQDPKWRRDCIREVSKRLTELLKARDKLSMATRVSASVLKYFSSGGPMDQDFETWRQMDAAAYWSIHRDVDELSSFLHACTIAPCSITRALELMDGIE